MTTSTARSHTQRILTKLNVHTRLEAAAIAVLLSLTMIVGAYPYLRRATRAELR